MIDQETMLNIIRTEALEVIRGPFEEKEAYVDSPMCRYDLRLVKELDGTLHWED